MRASPGGMLDRATLLRATALPYRMSVSLGRITQNSFPSGSASTVQDSSPVCPMSTRRAPRASCARAAAPLPAPENLDAQLGSVPPPNASRTHLPPRALGTYRAARHQTPLCLPRSGSGNPPDGAWSRGGSRQPRRSVSNVEAAYDVPAGSTGLPDAFPRERAVVSKE